MKVNWVCWLVLLLLVIWLVRLVLFGLLRMGTWYKNLSKPSFNPPSWVFGPVWTLLFSLMGVALYLVWVSPASQIRTIALVLFGVQFVLNVLWSYLFFGINNSLWSLVEYFCFVGWDFWRLGFIFGLLILMLDI